VGRGYEKNLGLKPAAMRGENTRIVMSIQAESRGFFGKPFFGEKDELHGGGKGNKLTDIGIERGNYL